MTCKTIVIGALLTILSGNLIFSRPGLFRDSVRIVGVLALTACTVALLLSPVGE